MKTYRLLFFLILFSSPIFAQIDESVEEDTPYLAPLNDKSLAGQQQYVIELLALAGYTVDDIIVYQTLPKNAKVFQVKFENSPTGGFVFVRWNKEKKENYVANKLIDAGFYYNLKAANEIYRKQTDSLYFSVTHKALQAPDQDEISEEDLENFRLEYDLQQEEKKLLELEKQSKSKAKRERKKNKEQ